MKKLITIIMALVACAALTACSGTPKGSENDTTAENFSDIELVRTGMVDRIVADNLEVLEKYSDIAVVGEFIGNAEQDIDYEYSEQFGKDIITLARSYNTVKVNKVLMGDVNVGDELKVTQLYGCVDGKLYSWSDSTPMQKGDEWIFFLSKQFGENYYWVTCDSDGRYPTKNSAAKNSRMSFAPEYQLGVYDKNDFNEKVYNEIVEKYDV